MNSDKRRGKPLVDSLVGEIVRKVVLSIKIHSTLVAHTEFTDSILPSGFNTVLV